MKATQKIITSWTKTKKASKEALEYYCLFSTKSTSKAGNPAKKERNAAKLSGRNDKNIGFTS